VRWPQFPETYRIHVTIARKVLYDFLIALSDVTLAIFVLCTMCEINVTLYISRLTTIEKSVFRRLCRPLIFRRGIEWEGRSWYRWTYYMQLPNSGSWGRTRYLNSCIGAIVDNAAPKRVFFCGGFSFSTMLWVQGACDQGVIVLVLDRKPSFLEMPASLMLEF
jgi:hypothetical protein